MAIQKGTGFTNLNRVLQANRGNNLGSAVTSGINQRVQGVKSSIKSAQDQFQEEANKNKLDTDEAKQQRIQTLGKFDATPINVDESQFKVSSGLQTDYDTRKTDTTGLLDKEKTTLAGLQDTSALDAARDKRQAEFNARLAELKKYNEGSGTYENRLYALQRDYGYDPAKRTNNIQSTYQQQVDAYNRANFDKVQQAQKNISSFDKQLADIESEYGTKSAAEKAAYIDAEQRKIQQSLLPSEQELSQFNKFTQGAYAGPTGLKDVEALNAKAQQMESLGNLARTTGGNQELLKQFVGGRDYTSGQRKLDETLLGQDGNIGRVARQARGITRSLDDATTGATSLAQEYQNKAKAFGEETRGMIESKQSPLFADLDQKITQAQSQQQDRDLKFSRVQDILGGKEFAGIDPVTRTNIALDQAVKSGLVSEADKASLMSPGGLIDQARKLGIDPNALLANKLKNTQSQNVSRSGLATGSENVRLAALNKLLGKQDYENEFNAANRFQEGSAGLDMAALQEFIRLSTPDAAAPTAPAPNLPIITGSGSGASGTGYNFSDKNLKENIDYNSKDLQKFMDRLKPAAYDYKDEVKDSPLASKNRELGVMAQDLEKSKLGDESVKDTDSGKVVDYDNLQPKMLASIAALNKRLKDLEGKK